MLLLSQNNALYCRSSQVIPRAKVTFILVYLRLFEDGGHTGDRESVAESMHNCGIKVRRLVGEEILDISKLVMNHESEKTHLGGAALVQFNGTLGELGISIEGVPAEVKGSVAEVTNVFVSSSWDVLHDGKFQEANEGQNLEGTGNRDGEGGIPAVSKVGELGARVVNVTWKVDSSSIDKVSNNSKHADAAMLDLNISEAVELLLVTISNNAKGIEESKRSLGTKFALESHVGGNRGFGGLRRSEGGGRGDEGSDDGGLHFYCNTTSYG
jgi:hypothetical protein